MSQREARRVPVVIAGGGPVGMVAALELARPGSRAPHCWLGDGEALHDHFGIGFTLLDFAAASERTADLRAAFARKRVPLKVLRVEDQRARELYGRDYVLVGADQHVFWRADSMPSDPDHLVDVVRGAVAEEGRR